jgi:hypothetical protein
MVACTAQAQATPSTGCSIAYLAVPVTFSRASTRSMGRPVACAAGAGGAVRVFERVEAVGRW